MRRRCKGTITVFLSLCSIFFLIVLFSVTESARVQGSRTQSANANGLAAYSLLGEYEKLLLDKYEIFALDGAYGGTFFFQGRITDRLETYLEENADPREGLFTLGHLDPFQLTLKDCRLVSYALLTDQAGEPFYQQAVSYMKENFGTEAILQYLHYYQDINTVEAAEESFENRSDANEEDMEEAEKQEEERKKELEEQAKNGETVQTESKVENPLWAIWKLKNKNLLVLMTGGASLSQEGIGIWTMPSHLRLKSGSMEIAQENSGLISDMLFREYLLICFPDYVNQEDTKLKYQTEYLIAGKSGDTDNLSSVVKRLLLLREGMNFLYCNTDLQMTAKAESLAAALTGFLGIPAITEITHQAILLAWAYGESLLDVRTLLSGGKVPLTKDTSTWQLSLEKLASLAELLSGTPEGSNQGMSYQDYLRLLLYMGPVNQQRLRALDLIQLNLQQQRETAGFLAENCIVGIETESTWNIKPVFYGLAHAVMGITSQSLTVKQTASICY